MSHFEGLQIGREPRMLPWQQHRQCPTVSFVMYISGAKFEEHCSNISEDSPDSVFNNYCLVELFMTSSLSSFA